MSIDSFYFYISNDIVLIMIPSIFFAPNIPCVDNLYFSGRGGAAAVVWFVLVTVRYTFRCIVFFSFLLFFHSYDRLVHYELNCFFSFISFRIDSFLFVSCIEGAMRWQIVNKNSWWWRRRRVVRTGNGTVHFYASFVILLSLDRSWMFFVLCFFCFYFYSIVSISIHHLLLHQHLYHQQPIFSMLLVTLILKRL